MLNPNIIKYDLGLDHQRQLCDIVDSVKFRGGRGERFPLPKSNGS